MKKTIVLTTIYEPQEATLKYCAMEGWDVIIVGDKKTPAEEYIKLQEKYADKVYYFSPYEQNELYPQLSDAIGWNTSIRRNLGFVHAYNTGAEVIAMVDDDNIPLENWGKDILINKKIIVDCYVPQLNQPVFDPLSVVEDGNKWHRGFPWQLLDDRYSFKQTTMEIIPKIQAGLWLGDPDVDAVQRLLPDYSSLWESPFKISPYTSTSMIPFDSQNTFISRDMIKYFMLIPNIGRVDDIWGAYYLQMTQDTVTNYMPYIVFTEPTVIQKRNQHNLFKDMKEELYGYENALKFINGEIIKEDVRKFAEIYRKSFCDE